MPLYEYACRDCGAAFERRRRFEERQDAAPCPACGSAAEAVLSAPAVVGVAASPRGSASSHPGCACGGGGCAAN